MRNLILVFVLFTTLVIFLLSCSDKYPTPVEKFAVEKNSCTNCHLNAELLKEVADPLPVDPGGDTGET